MLFSRWKKRGSSEKYKNTSARPCEGKCLRSQRNVLSRSPCELPSLRVESSDACTWIQVPRCYKRLKRDLEAVASQRRVCRELQSARTITGLLSRSGGNRTTRMFKYFFVNRWRLYYDDAGCKKKNCYGPQSSERITSKIE